MTIPNTNVVPLVYPPSHSALSPARRLIVLVPAERDYLAASRRIRELARTLESNVLFLSLYTDQAQESSLRRQLITMAALVQEGNLCAEIRVELGSNWVTAVKADLHDDDMIVCFGEQRTGMLRRPLSQTLQSNLKSPVYILSDLDSQSRSRFNWRSQIMAWAGSLAIIAGFFLIQIQITTLLQDWAQTTLLTLSVVAEIWLIAAWNRLF